MAEYGTSLKTLSPNTATWRVKASTYELGRGMHSLVHNTHPASGLSFM